ncbi:MAG: hypothetical protein ABIF10_02455 [Candidatus Woesearchaeota archaeon]
MRVALVIALIATVVFCLGLPSVSALTASIGNARMIIHTDASPEQPAVIQKSIRVNNVNDVPVQIGLRSQGDIKDYTEVLDKGFTLQPGETVDARFVITLEYGGTYEGKILVDFFPVEGSTKQTPVGLASTVIIISQGPQNPNPPTGSEEVSEEDLEYVNSEPAEEPAEVMDNPDTVSPSSAGKSLQSAKEKASPLVGMMIIGFVIIIGIVVYWWYMRD